MWPDGRRGLFCGIPRSEVLVNGPLWCYYYALRHLEHGQSGVAQRMAVSQPDNNAIVFGTENFAGNIGSAAKGRTPAGFDARRK